MHAFVYILHYIAEVMKTGVVWRVRHKIPPVFFPRSWEAAVLRPIKQRQEQTTVLRRQGECWGAHSQDAELYKCPQVVIVVCSSRSVLLHTFASQDVWHVVFGTLGERKSMLEMQVSGQLLELGHNTEPPHLQTQEDGTRSYVVCTPYAMLIVSPEMRWRTPGLWSVSACR